ncbi:MAG: DHH family phosphoesterase [Lachnospiraceae bacterium]|nr:DHH family phosphoesterase [Lachnospiraceae bacterium]
MTNANPMMLVELLKGHRTYIQTHNYPDPDAVASAFGLQTFLRYHGVEARICYDGSVERMSTKKMFKVFQIEATDADELKDMTEDDYIVTVDSQKYNANLTDLIGDEVACIDHHPTYIPCEYRYKDIRTVGACASLITEYFVITDTPMDANTAAALAYGIKMDTNDFIRGATELDVDMFDYLFKQADKEKIREMYSNVMELSDLNAYAAAIESIRIFDEVGFASIPFDCPDAMIAIISDFILSLEMITISIVYASRSEGIKFSVRSEVPQKVDAGELIRKALEGIGSGGGHKQMAGGFMPTSADTPVHRAQIEALFLRILDPENKSKQALTPDSLDLCYDGVQFVE